MAGSSYRGKRTSLGLRPNGQPTGFKGTEASEPTHRYHLPLNE
jgi:ribosomal protein S13